jgi:hypothetical protein
VLRKRKVFIAHSMPQDEGNGDIIPGYGEPSAFFGSVYPITSGQEAQYYGVEPNNSFRLILPVDSGIKNGDGVWLDEMKEGKPPFEVVAAPVWMLTVQAVIKEATGWRK